MQGYSKKSISLMNRVKLVQKEPNPINRLLLEVTFSFIITTGHPRLPDLAVMMEGIWRITKHKAVTGVCSKIRVPITKRNMWDQKQQSTSYSVCLSLSLDAQVQYGFIPPCLCGIVTGDCTSKQTIKCKGFLGKLPMRGPTTRLIYSF